MDGLCPTDKSSKYTPAKHIYLDYLHISLRLLVAVRKVDLYHFKGTVSYENIVKGTTDPRVEFSSPKVASLVTSDTNLDQISSSESQSSINFKISTKHQHLD